MLNRLIVKRRDKISSAIQKKFNEIVFLIEQSELIDSESSTNHTENILDELAFKLNDIIDRIELK